MRAVKDLPSNYHFQNTLNLSSIRASILLNLAAIPLIFVFGWTFEQLIIVLRPINPFPDGVFNFLITIPGLKVIILLFLVVLMLVVHELTHGLFFWIFTHKRPNFALKPGYAFAAAPLWYIPYRQYMIVGLSPFIIITIISISLAMIVPLSIIPYFLFIATFNAAGALGDFLVVSWILRQPKNILVKDEGDIFHSYVPDEL